MSGKTKTKSKECKHCQCSIDFGMYCEACVSSERVCQMCGVSIVELDDSAFVCSPKHRTSKSRAKAAIREAQQDVTCNVTDTPELPVIEPVKVYLQKPLEIEKYPSNVTIEGEKFYEQIIAQQQQQIELLQEMVKLLQSQIGNNDFVPPLAKPLEYEDEDLPMPEVKQSTKQGQSSQNFLNSILALG